MTLWSLVLILVWLVTFVAGQLFFKRAMELSSAAAFRNRKVIFILGAGLLSMTISLTMKLTIGSLLITVGVVLVSLS